MNPDVKDLVLVIIPAFNAEKTIVRSIDSALAQSRAEVNVVVLIVDDFSADATIDLVKNRYDSKSVVLIRNNKNYGTYISANNALHYSSRNLQFTHYLIHGADDEMLKDKIYKQVIKIKNREVLACRGSYKRVRIPSGEILAKGLGHSMLVYSRKVFEILGYFDDTRFGGDSEYYHRFLKCFAKNQLVDEPGSWTTAYTDIDNLTLKIPENSNYRAKYLTHYSEIHEKMLLEGDFYMGIRPPHYVVIE